MNLRQKAKRYKQKCKQLEKMAFPYKQHGYLATEKPIITLEAKQIIDTALLGIMSDKEECYESYINKKLASEFAHGILNCAKIGRFPYLDSEKEIIVATIKVLDLKEH